MKDRFSLLPLGLVALLLLSAGPALSHRRSGPKPAGNVRVFDSNGADLGTFLGWPINLDRLAVLIDDLGIIMHLDVDTGRLESNGSVFFEQANCEGIGWMEATFGQYLQGPMVEVDLFAVGNGPAEQKTLNVLSVRRGSSGLRCDTLSSELTGVFVPTKLVAASELGVTIPPPAPLRIGRRHLR